MAEYIERGALMQFPIRRDHYDRENGNEHFINGIETVLEYAENLPAADVAPVVRCKDCAHSTFPSELTQRYGKPGTLTCHNMHAPSNRRNVGSNDFCSYGERRDKP